MIAVIIEAAKKGNSERNHIKRILKLKEINQNLYVDLNNREVIFYQMGGKGELLKRDKYKVIVKKAESLFFILDADEDYKDTKNKITKLINFLKQEYSIKKADFFISCNPDTKKGNIESLLLFCVKENLKECYSNFLECLGKEKLERYNEKKILEKLFEIENPPYDLECEYLKLLRKQFYSL